METLVLLFLVIIFIVLKLLIFGTGDKLARDKKKFAPGIKLCTGREYVRALAWFSDAVAANPESALAWAMRGRCHLACGNLYASLGDLSRALSLESNLPDAYLDKGKALYKLEDYDAALLELDKAVWYFRENAEAFRFRGKVHLALGQNARARQDFTDAVMRGDEDAAYLMRKMIVNGKQY
ncbi:MAG: tetratricopeptide repeat protein [Bacteroidota bacterium]